MAAGWRQRGAGTQETEADKDQAGHIDTPKVMDTLVVTLVYAFVSLCLRRKIHYICKVIALNKSLLFCEEIS